SATDARRAARTRTPRARRRNAARSTPVRGRKSPIVPGTSSSSSSDGTPRCLLGSENRSKQSMTIIDRSADEDEREPDADKNRGVVQRLLALARRGPAHEPLAEQRRPLALEPCRSSVADEEAGDEQEAADAVEGDRDRPVHARLEEHAPEQADEQAERGERAEQHGEAARSAADEAELVS